MATKKETPSSKMHQKMSSLNLINGSTNYNSLNSSSKEYYSTKNLKPLATEDSKTGTNSLLQIDYCTKLSPNTGNYVYLPVHLRTTSAMISRSNSVKKCRLEDDIRKHEKMIDSFTQFDTTSSTYHLPINKRIDNQALIANLQRSQKSYKSGSVIASGDKRMSASKKFNRFIQQNTQSKNKHKSTEEIFDFVKDLARRGSPNTEKRNKFKSPNRSRFLNSHGQIVTKTELLLNDCIKRIEKLTKGTESYYMEQEPNYQDYRLDLEGNCGADPYLKSGKSRPGNSIAKKSSQSPKASV